MAISDPDDVMLMIQRVGDVDPITAEPVWPLTAGGNGIIMINSERIWNKYIYYRQIQPALLGQEIFDHYFMLVGCQLVSAVLADRISFSAVGTAVRVDLSDRWEHRKALMDTLRLELDVLFKQSAQYSIPQITLLKHVVPISPPVPGQLPTPEWEVGTANPFVPDANSYIIQGSPYWSEWKRW